MFQGEPVLYTYDWSGGVPELLEKQSIPLKGFKLCQGFDAGSLDMGKIGDFKIRPYPSEIVNLTKYGEDLLISYVPSPRDKDAVAKVAAGEASEETKKD